jgi:hypothetical protein
MLPGINISWKFSLNLSNQGRLTYLKGSLAPYLLTRDPVQEPVAFGRGGAGLPLAGPGLGVRILEDVLDELALSGHPVLTLLGRPLGRSPCLSGSGTKRLSQLPPLKIRISNSGPGCGSCSGICRSPGHLAAKALH